MLIVFNPEEERVLKRNNSLSKIPVVIADDVNPVDDVAIEFLEDKILVKKTGLDVEVTKDSEWLYIGKTAGFFGAHKGFKSIVELIACDECMVLTLKKGAITVHPDANKPEDVIVIASGLESDEYPAPYLTDIKWLDGNYILGLCKFFGDYLDRYPMDYMLQLIIEGKGGKLPTVGIAKLGISDISYGILASIKASEVSKARQKQLKSAMSALASTPSKKIVLTTVDEEEADPDDYDDEEYED